MCPIPTVKTSLAMEEMAPGQILELRADDPITKRDLPGWCREMGHQILAIHETGSYFTIYLQKKG